MDSILGHSRLSEFGFPHLGTPPPRAARYLRSGDCFPVELAPRPGLESGRAANAVADGPARPPSPPGKEKRWTKN